jgi:tellurite resistance protein TehA-like permease
VRPDVFAAVMATGIVSIAAADHGYHIISDVLVVLAAVAFPLLIVMAARAWHRFDFRDPDLPIGLFTYVAACAVLGARLAEHRIVLWVFAGMALQGWLSLAPLVVRRMWGHRTELRARAHGAWELASVATSGLAIVSADLEIVFLAMLFWVLAICVYLLMTGLIVWRVDLSQPDSWILMGGAAIATLAGDHIHLILIPGPIADGVRVVTIVTWVVATLWIPPLIYATVRRFAGIGWPTVFPLGMYSSATCAMYVESGWQWLTTVSLAFFWIALPAWVIVAIRSRNVFRRSRAAGTP